MEKLKTLNIRVPDYVYNQISAEAIEQDKTKTDIIFQHLNQYYLPTNQKNDKNIKNGISKKFITSSTKITADEAKAFSQECQKLNEKGSRVLRKLIREFINDPIRRCFPAQKIY